MLKELILTTRTRRLVTITILTSLCLVLAYLIISAIIIIRYFWNQGQSPDDQIIKLAILLIIFMFGVIGLAYFSLSLSAEEETAHDRRNREEIIRNLGEAISAALNVTVFDMELAIIIRKFSDCVSGFKTEDLSSHSIKMLLTGAANSLAIIYYCLDLKDYQKRRIIAKKPQGWDYILKATQQEISNMSGAKKKLQESYEQIEYFARRHIGIISDTGKNRYTLYADAEVLLLLRNRRKKMSKGSVPMKKYYYC